MLRHFMYSEKSCSFNMRKRQTLFRNKNTNIYKRKREFTNIYFKVLNFYLSQI